VVASRLTESHQFSVLLVEAGPKCVLPDDDPILNLISLCVNTLSSNEGVLDIQVPAFWTQINSTYNWNYVTEPLSGLNNRTLEYARGHVLGGSSSISAFQACRAEIWSGSSVD
jgi:choline dehydrogenase